MVAELHVQTVGDLLAFPAATLTAKFGPAVGAFLAALPHAVDDTPVRLPAAFTAFPLNSLIMRSSAPSCIGITKMPERASQLRRRAGRNNL